MYILRTHVVTLQSQREVCNKYYVCDIICDVTSAVFEASIQYIMHM